MRAHLRLGAPRLCALPPSPQDTLNAFMGMGRSAWREARTTLGRLLSKQEGALRDRRDLCQRAIIPAVRSRCTVHRAAAPWSSLLVPRVMVTAHALCRAVRGGHAAAGCGG